MPKASKQLDALVSSDNAKRRQSSNKKAVVSIRLTGGVIAQLDDAVAHANANKETEGWPTWKHVTRSDVMLRAVHVMLTTTRTEKPTPKKKGR